jgi:UDP-N-acetylmuramoyl-tripeptide--D-alanyl-D-alanine ligase
MAQEIGTMVPLSTSESGDMNLYYSLLKLKTRVLTGKKITTNQLRLEQAFQRRKKLANTRFIAVTGSSAKTSTTELVHYLLSDRFSAVLSSGGNTIKTFRKSVLEISPDKEFAVFEVSGHEPGAIDVGCALLRPHIGIITLVSSEHISTFRNLENVAVEKGRLAENLPPEGLLFLNADDPAVFAMRERTRAGVVTFGLHEKSDYRATDIEPSPDGCLRFVCHHGKERHPFVFRLLGRHFVSVALAGIAVAHQSGIPFPAIVERGRTFPGVAGRCSLHKGRDGSIYVCDTVKAPFATVNLALDVVSIFSGVPRKTIVLGTISDTRRGQSRRYRSTCKKALGLADRVVLYGSAANNANIDEDAETSGRVVRIEEIGALRNYLVADHIPGEMVFLKGSFKVDHLERIALHAQQPVDCWLQCCGKVALCFDCTDLRKEQKR